MFRGRVGVLKPGDCGVRRKRAMILAGFLPQLLPMKRRNTNKKACNIKKPAKLLDRASLLGVGRLAEVRQPCGWGV